MNKGLQLATRQNKLCRFNAYYGLNQSISLIVRMYVCHQPPGNFQSTIVHRGSASKNSNRLSALEKTSQELQKAALRVTQLSRCQGVFTKKCHYNYFCHYCNFYYYHNLSFQVVTIFFCFLVLHGLSF